MPMTCIARYRLYASTCKLISVLTHGSAGFEVRCSHPEFQRTKCLLARWPAGHSYWSSVAMYRKCGLSNWPFKHLFQMGHRARCDETLKTNGLKVEKIRRDRRLLEVPTTHRNLAFLTARSNATFHRLVPDRNCDPLPAATS